MSKLTRTAYIRKAVVMGCSLLGGVAMVSTGFAAWVLSSDQSKGLNGNVQVGAVSDSSMTLSVDFKTGSGTNFVFEPKSDDDTGRVRHDTNPSNVENLSVTFSGTVTATSDVLGALTVKFAKDSGIDSAVSKNYITVQEECYDTEFDLLASTTPAYVTKSGSLGAYTWSFEYTISFGWGSKFNNMNPGNYYDEDSSGVSLFASEAATVLDDLHTCLKDTATYSVTFTAKLS